jgi:polyphosphate kinase
MTALAVASIGDHGALTTRLPHDLSEIWIDRDLSWLDFNERVLAEALDERTPLLERAKFLAIFTSNLDEFFMKRVSVLRHGTGEEHRALLEQMRDKLLPMLAKQAECYRQSVVPGLAKHGVLLRHWDELTACQRKEASEYFDSSVSAALTPLVIDPEHPFPFLSNLSTSLTFRLKDPEHPELMQARVKVPAVLKNWIPLASDLEKNQKLFVPLYEVIRGNIQKLYDGMTISGISLLRITRDAEVEADDDSSAGVRELVKAQIRQRRYEPIVRLEFGPGADPAIKESLRDRFQLGPSDVYDMAEEVDYPTLFEIASLPLPELHDRPWIPLQHPSLPEIGAGFFAAIQARDVMVHHPYDSFDGSIEHFISLRHQC